MDNKQKDLKKKIEQSITPYNWGGTTNEWEEHTEEISQIKELLEQANENNKDREKTIKYASRKQRWE